jgi:penicillin-binding protein 1A
MSAQGDKTTVNVKIGPILRWTLLSVISLTVGLGYALACAFVYLQPSLPTVEAMRNADMQVPLRVYARSGQLMAQIGEQRRIPVAYEQVPEQVRQAFLAAEDDRFFQHHGFDYAGIVRSTLNNVFSRSTQGASTITMQTARSMFLTQRRDYRRKLQEVFVTYRLEREFTKEQIFALYLNAIFFGHRAYGVAAAAETYFGKSLEQLTLAETATLARVPQSPSRINPISAPEEMVGRRGYVLRRMTELGYITPQQAETAASAKIRARIHSPNFEIEAPYLVEMVRLEVIKRFGAQAPNEGYKVFTTVDTRLQAAANRAVRLGLIEHDRRHGWRGAQNRVELGSDESEANLSGIVDEYPTIGPLAPAVVVNVAARSARVFARNRGFVNIEWDGLSWARRKVNDDEVGPEPKAADEILARGDVIYVLVGRNNQAQLVQVPEAESALIALDPDDGAIAALVGGFDYFESGRGKFNRATQARRQPGSAFKPFLYSGALENGFTAASVVMDAPIIVDDPSMEEAWRPENSSGQFYGPTRLREALVKSRNLVSIRILQEMGVRRAIDYATRFGFTREQLPANLTLALGTMPATPLEIASGFAVFANGGFRIAPYFVDRIEDPSGKIVYQATPRSVCRECEQNELLLDGRSGGATPASLRNFDTIRDKRSLPPPEQRAERAISAQNHWLIDNMMAEVITRGTGRRALALGRNDLAGKTGTTNDAKDTWFNGYSPDLVGTVWVGYDQERSLGRGEEGARTAVPIWVNFMREALRNVPQRSRPLPEGLVQVRVNPDNGAVASADDPTAIFETFMTDRLPTGGVLGGGEVPVDGINFDGDSAASPGAGTNASGGTANEPLF